MTVKKKIIVSNNSNKSRKGKKEKKEERAEKKRESLEREIAKNMTYQSNHIGVSCNDTGDLKGGALPHGWVE